MEIFFLMLVLVVIVVVGNLLVLLRTAKQPKVPDSVKAKPYDDEEGGW